MKPTTKETIYITGHKNPDTDSIISAISYAELKNKLGEYNAVPVRLGPINRETRYILDHFDMEEPDLVETMKLRVSDLNYDKSLPVESDISLKMAWNLMGRNNVNSLTIVDEEAFLKGIITVTGVTKSYMDVWDTSILAKSKTPVENIIDTLSGTYLVNPLKPKPITGKMVVVASTPEEAAKFIDEGDIAIVGNIPDQQKTAVDSKVAFIIVTNNNDLTEELKERCEAEGITVIQTSFDTFTAARVLPQAVPISYIMTCNNLVAFSTYDLIEDVSPIMAQTRFRSYPIVNNEKRVIGTLSRYHLISSRKKKVILVDHNERSQSVEGLADAEIMEIIDHHRVADVVTGAPIYFRNEPVGSTSTIIATIFFENGIRPSKKVAGLLAAAIISDTLLFKSPTSTHTDRMILDRLSKIADMDVEDFAMKMFKAGTSLEGKTPEELLSQDFKTFTIDKQKIGISQVYSLDASALIAYRENLLSLMDQRAKKEGYTIYGLLITDIFKESSEMILTGPDKDLMARAFDKTIVNDSIILPGVLSRKKQVIPVVTNVIMNRTS